MSNRINATTAKSPSLSDAVWSPIKIKFTASNINWRINNDEKKSMFAKNAAIPPAMFGK